MKLLLAIPLLLVLAPGGFPQDEKRFSDRLVEVNTFLKTAKAVTDFKAAIEELQGIAQEAAAADLYDIPVKALDQADKIARGLKDIPLLSSIQAKLADAKSLQQEYTKVKPATKILMDKPDDPEANLTVGKFLAVVKGDWARGLELLRKGSDPTLRGLADAEFLGGTAVETKIELGDRWFAYAEKNPRYKERGWYWYKLAWPDLKGLSKEKVRAKFKSIAYHANAKITDGCPRGWGVVIGPGEKIEGLATDETYAHSGKASWRITKAARGLLVTEMVKLPSEQEFELSFWHLSEDTRVADLMSVHFFDHTDKEFVTSAPMPPDQPWWSMSRIKVKSPPDTKGFRLFFFQTGMGNGTVWIDDVSFKSLDKGTEFILNGSFEEKK